MPRSIVPCPVRRLVASLIAVVQAATPHLGNAEGASRALRRAGKSLQGGSRPDDGHAARISRRSQKTAEVVNEASVNQQQWFPKGTGPEAGKTRALPEIWSKPADFDSRAEDVLRSRAEVVSRGEGQGYRCREGRVQGSRRRLQELPRHIPLAGRIVRDDGGRIAGIPTRIRVWDVPTRVVHWLVVLLVALSWWTAETGRMEWHRWSGYTLLGLRDLPDLLGLLRQLHGAVQPVRARAAHDRELSEGQLGRGTGSQSVGCAERRGAAGAAARRRSLLGLFAVDVDGIESGPLSTYVSFEAGRAAAEWHEDVFNVLSWLIVLHIAAVIYYVFFRKRTVGRGDGARQARVSRAAAATHARSARCRAC